MSKSEYLWWKVIGICHRAIVKAKSGKEAIEKAEDKKVVHDWEIPTVEKTGFDLPDVIEI